MSHYLPLFSVSVGHAFFADAMCRGVHFEPGDVSATVLEKSGCMIRPAPAGFSVFYDAARLEVLRACLADADEPFCLGFVGYVDDPRFDAYTGGYTDSRYSILAFDSATAIFQSTEKRFRLHAEEYVSDADRQPADFAEKLLRAAQRKPCLPPKLIVRIMVVADDLDGSGAEGVAQGKHYYLRFRSQATFWQYYLLGEWPQEQVNVVDLNDKTSFAPQPAKCFANGRVALTIRSQTTIPLQERSAQRFQLRGLDHGIERVIVKRLPVASADQFNIEEHHGAPTWVSEIYVNC